MILAVFLYALVAVVTVGADEALNKEVDGYVQKWYAQRMATKIPLSQITRIWESGIIFKDKTTLHCKDGVLNLEGSVIRRISNASYVQSNSTRRAWVSVKLGLSPETAFSFNDCSLHDDKKGNKTGSLSGTMANGSAVDLLYSFRAVWWWCQVYTLKVTVLEDSVKAVLDNKGAISESLPEDGLKDVLKDVVFSLANSATLSWLSLLGGGPQSPDSNC